MTQEVLEFDPYSFNLTPFINEGQKIDSLQEEVQELKAKIDALIQQNSQYLFNLGAAQVDLQQSPPFTATLISMNTFIESHQKALQYFTEGKWKEAEVVYRFLLLIQKDVKLQANAVVDLQIQLFCCMVAQHKYNEAKVLVEALCALYTFSDEQKARVYPDLILTLSKLHEYVEMRKIAREFAKLPNPDTRALERYYLNFCTVLLEKGEINEAKKIINKALEQGIENEQKAELCAALADHLFKTGKYAEAQVEAERGVNYSACWERKFQLTLLKINCLNKSKEYSAAENSCKKLLKDKAYIEQDKGVLYSLLVEALWIQDKKKEAVEIAVKVLQQENLDEQTKSFLTNIAEIPAVFTKKRKTNAGLEKNS